MQGIKKTQPYTMMQTGYPETILKFNFKGIRLHPTQKPIELFEYLIKVYTDKDNLILDFAIGSGTTAIACEYLSRRWIGIEKSEKYCEIAAERIDRLQTQDSKPHPSVKRIGLRPFL